MGKFKAQSKGKQLLIVDNKVAEVHDLTSDEEKEKLTTVGGSVVNEWVSNPTRKKRSARQLVEFTSAKMVKHLVVLEQFVRQDTNPPAVSDETMTQRETPSTVGKAFGTTVRANCMLASTVLAEQSTLALLPPKKRGTQKYKPV